MSQTRGGPREGSGRKPKQTVRMNMSVAPDVAAGVDELRATLSARDGKRKFSRTEVFEHLVRQAMAQPENEERR